MISNREEHRCIVCDKTYIGCLNCPKIFSAEEYETFNMSEYIQKNKISDEQKKKMFLGYKSICCDFSHYLVFMLIKQFKKSQITLQEIKNELQLLGYNEMNILEFKESVRNYLFENIYNVEDNIEDNMITESLNVNTYEQETIKEPEEKAKPKQASRRRKG